MNYDYYWGKENGDGQVMAKDHGLTSPHPTMCNTRASGDFLYMFESGNKYYLWNRIEGHVWVITVPQELRKIIAQIGDKGVGSLKIKLVSQV